MSRGELFTNRDNTLTEGFGSVSHHAYFSFVAEVVNFEDFSIVFVCSEFKFLKSTNHHANRQNLVHEVINVVMS